MPDRPDVEGLILGKLNALLVESRELPTDAECREFVRDVLTSIGHDRLEALEAERAGIEDEARAQGWTPMEGSGPVLAQYGNACRDTAFRYRVLARANEILAEHYEAAARPAPTNERI